MGCRYVEEFCRDDLHLALTSEEYVELRAKLLQFLPESITLPKNHVYLDPLPWKLPRTRLYPTHLPLFKEIVEYLESLSWNREIIDTTPGNYAHSNPDLFDHVSVIGNYALTDRHCKTKWVSDTPWTPTEILNGYLHLCQEYAGEFLRVDYYKNKHIYKHGATIYFNGYYEGQIGYLDLNRAYWQILSPTRLDMQYDPVNQEIASIGRIPYIHPEQFGSCKDVYLLTHTLFNYKISRVWDPKLKRSRPDSKPSPLYRPYNYAYIMDMMNAIVSDVSKNFTLLQWLTDAPIVQAKDTENVQEFLKEEWGLNSRIEAMGAGISKNTNVYRIEAGNGYPGKKTKHFHTSDRGHQHIRLRLGANVEGLKIERQKLLKKQYVDFNPPKRPKYTQGFQGGYLAFKDAKPMEITKLASKPYRPCNDRLQIPKEK